MTIRSDAPAILSPGLAGVMIAGTVASLLHWFAFAAPHSGVAGYQVPAFLSWIASFGFLGTEFMFLAAGVALAALAEAAPGRMAFARSVTAAAGPAIVIALGLSVVGAMLIGLGGHAPDGAFAIAFPRTIMAPLTAAILGTAIVVAIGHGEDFARRLLDIGSLWLIVAMADQMLGFSSFVGRLVAAEHAPALISGLLMYRLSRRRADRSEQMLLIFAAIATTACSIVRAHEIGDLYGIAPRADVVLILTPGLLLFAFAAIDQRHGAVAPLMAGRLMRGLAIGWLMSGGIGLALVSGLARAAPAGLGIAAAVFLLTGLGVAIDHLTRRPLRADRTARDEKALEAARVAAEAEEILRGRIAAIAALPDASADQARTKTTDSTNTASARPA
ncbi:hypothetical protein [Methylobrevis pamukkalensis]|uniref:Uncharacterized protein n=1 Tax=Methylobrevis pamukkalensis TaxID=1439726 RepID=A0A1E3GYL2_9HYPH|nr:hypothetical protein [Methylobrevis pamukkalensis]ODN69132.1 hypothetical protein A6302_03573 [Methylobrevis pamukkalensis]